MKKEQIKLYNFALSMALERYRACYDIERKAKKMWRKDCVRVSRELDRVTAVSENDKATIKTLTTRIYHLERRSLTGEPMPTTELDIASVTKD